VDLRGHSQSERRIPYDALVMMDDSFAVVDERADDDPLMIGHSLGGFAVSAYAGSHSSRATINVDQPVDLSGFHEFVAPWRFSLRGDEETFSSATSQLMDPLFGAVPDAERARIESL
jgi:pimeloyl-ACP methyl ester carboxylesterase